MFTSATLAPVASKRKVLVGELDGAICEIVRAAAEKRAGNRTSGSMDE
jgi:hypothetical protein